MARIVVAKHRLPYPAVTGTDVVTFNLLRALATRHDVTLVSMIAREDQRRWAPAFEAAGVRLELVTMPNKRGLASRVFFKAFYTAAAFLSASPRDLWYFNPPAFRNRVRAAARDADLLQLEYWFLYPTAAGVRGPRKVLLAHDAEFSANRRLLAVTANPLLRFPRWFRMVQRRALETAACRRFDEVLCLSAADAALLAPWTPRPPRVVFPVVDLPPRAALSRGFPGKTLIYFGGTRRPCVHHGLSRFLRDIYPLVRAAAPDARLVIMGEEPRASVRRLAARDPSVRIAAPAADLSAALAEAAVAVVPLWAGAGIKVKILTAFAHGLPVVTTPVGAEGIPVRLDAELVVAEDDPAFARAVVRLLTDRGAWDQLAAAGRAFAERELAPAVRDPQLAELYAELAAA